MKSKLLNLFFLIILICCLGASNKSSYQSCFPNACGEKGDYCQTPSLTIWKDYCESAGLRDKSASGVYSGTCFHEAPNRDPFYPHHGVILIYKLNSNYHFAGEFAFFAEGNPFRKLDVRDAKGMMLPRLFADDHRIKWNPDHARVLLNPEMETYHQVNYFLRESPDDNEKLFLVGYWKGTAHRVFCELKRNE